MQFSCPHVETITWPGTEILYQHLLWSVIQGYWLVVASIDNFVIFIHRAFVNTSFLKTNTSQVQYSNDMYFISGPVVILKIINSLH